jgi:hypothetical protein
MYTRPLLLHAGPSSLVGTRPVCRAHRPRRRQRQLRAHHQLIHAIRQTNLTILLVLQMSLRLIPANLAYTRRSHHEIYTPRARTAAERRSRRAMNTCVGKVLDQFVAKTLGMRCLRTLLSSLRVRVASVRAEVLCTVLAKILC